MRGTIQLGWRERAGQGAFDAALAGVETAAAHALAALTAVRDAAPDFARLCERAQQLRELTQRFAADPDPGDVR